MIEIARELGVPAKFPGSGGAIIGVYEDEEQCNRLRETYVDRGFQFAELNIQGEDYRGL